MLALHKAGPGLTRDNLYSLSPLLQRQEWFLNSEPEIEIKPWEKLKSDNPCTLHPLAPQKKLGFFFACFYFLFVC